LTDSKIEEKNQYCGYVAIVGRPNVGKSTLLNHILGMKLSITSRKPQTTRHQILGVKTQENIQTIYVDTPGIHQRRGTAINKYMNRAATSVLNDVDVILFVVQAKNGLKKIRLSSKNLKRSVVRLFWWSIK
jgi:GTP-binding protein Era